ncbi:MAG: GNAT family N-acetyltransferase [Pseudolabrys sp.]
MSETLHIRAAQRADLPGVLALYAQPDFDGGSVLPLEEAEHIFARFARYPDYTLYVAEHDKQIVGTFALLSMDKIGHLGVPEAIVEDVVVDAALHGGGIGKAMMAFAADIARKKNCYKLVLSSNAKRVAAHEFYERLGFERHGYSFRLSFDEVTA